MKLYKSIWLLAFTLSTVSYAQNDEESSDTLAKPEKEYQRAAFEGSSLVETQTDILNTKGTLEMVMNHRFGLVDEKNSLIGIYGQANIRLALNYSITDRITIGVGTAKDDRMVDFNAKVALFRQTKDEQMPVNVTYYGNFANNALPKENFQYTSDRFSFFNQIIVSRRINSNLSLLISPSYSHYNLVEFGESNDVFALSLGGRMKISPKTAILLDYTHSFSTNDLIEDGFAIGAEFATSAHAFQVFITNYRGINAQKNIMQNQNDFFSGDFVIGFNINRLWRL